MCFTGSILQVQKSIVAVRTSVRGSLDDREWSYVLEKMVRMGYLFDFYGPLLTRRQQDFTRLYYHHDLSLGEIAERCDITRQAVYDTLKRSEKSLEDYEDKLMLYERMKQFRAALDELEMIVDCDFQKQTKQGACCPQACGPLRDRLKVKIGKLKEILAG